MGSAIVKRLSNFQDACNRIRSLARSVLHLPRPLGPVRTRDNHLERTGPDEDRRSYCTAFHRLWLFVRRALPLTFAQAASPTIPGFSGKKYYKTNIYKINAAFKGFWGAPRRGS
jgi:hypothetical protein